MEKTSNFSKNLLSVVVFSYDGYSDLWAPFFDFFDIFWSNCEFPVYLVSNYKTLGKPYITPILTGEEVSWFHRTIKALENIESEYILFFLEDYFITSPVSNQKIAEIVAFMAKYDLNFYKLVDYPKTTNSFEGNALLGAVDDTLRYGINLQFGIWKKDFFLHLLNSIPNGKSPWDFETFFVNNPGSTIHKEIDFSKIVSDRIGLCSIVNGVYKGKWFRKSYRICKSYNVSVDLSRRTIMTVWQTLKYNLVIYAKKHFSERCQNRVKKLFSKLGYQSLTK